MTIDTSNTYRFSTAAVDRNEAAAANTDQHSASNLSTRALASVTGGSIFGQMGTGAQDGGMIGALAGLAGGPATAAIVGAAGAGIGATIWGSAAVGYEYGKHGLDVSKWDWSS